MARMNNTLLLTKKQIRLLYRGEKIQVKREGTILNIGRKHNEINKILIKAKIDKLKKIYKKL